MEIKKYLDISLQNRDEVYEARDYNAEHDYEYLIRDTNNLIVYDNLAYLLRIGYELCIYEDCVVLKHKTYKKQYEEI